MSHCMHLIAQEKSADNQFNIAFYGVSNHIMIRAFTKSFQKNIVVRDKKKKKKVDHKGIYMS